MPRYAITTQGDAYHLVDTERQSEAVLYPKYGFNCVSFTTTPDLDGASKPGAVTQPVAVFVPPHDVTALKESPFHAGQPILFPFPNRVREGKFSFDGQDYEMAELLGKGWDKGAGQAIHGLVADKAWTVEEAHASDSGATLRASLQLDAFPEIYQQYPFGCKISVTYLLQEGVLEMQTMVENTGTKALPMGFGIHPWFPVRLRAGEVWPTAGENVTPEERGRAEVRVPSEEVWELDKLMPTGKRFPVDAFPEHSDLREFRPLQDTFYDDVFTGVLYGEDGWSEGGLRDPESGLEMYLAADGAFREWVLYAPLDRPVIALEPYTCVTDAVNLHPKGIDAGLVCLPAGESWQGVIRFGLRHVTA